MSELNLKCHYQMVRSQTPHGEEFTVHEAFSTDSGVLHMMSPIPVYVMGDSKEDVSELASMLEKDIERYPLVDMKDVQPALDRYIDYTNDPIELEFSPDYSTDNVDVDEEDNVIDDGYDSNDDKVLDLCEYMKRKK